MKNVTTILEEVRNGSPEAQEALFRAVHDELHRLAGAQMRGQAPGHTLQTTALVNEAYLRLVKQEGASWEDRAHFFGTAAKAMRSILVDMARRRHAQKRGGGRGRETLEDGRIGAVDPGEDVLAVHDALERLEKIDPKGSRVVELRFFAGLDLEETARVMGVNERTVRRAWDEARAWLYREMSR